ncbi:MAG: ATP-binding cassette domain-containing protein [Desulfobacterota bacterium]|nr:ATP-binding cassette domain-containing protein [Thermodesulfobacteriota bacterium]
MLRYLQPGTRLIAVIVLISFLQLFHSGDLFLVSAYTVLILTFSLFHRGIRQPIFLFSIFTSGLGYFLGIWAFYSAGGMNDTHTLSIFKFTPEGFRYGICTGLRMSASTALGLAFLVSTPIHELHAAIPFQCLKRPMLEWLRLIQILKVDFLCTARSLRIRGFRIRSLLSVMIQLDVEQLKRNIEAFIAVSMQLFMRMMRLSAESQITIYAHYNKPYLDSRLTNNPHALTASNVKVLVDSKEGFAVKAEKLNLQRGKIALVIGKDKAGKTTLLQALSGVAQEKDQIVEGDITIHGIHVSAFTSLEDWSGFVRYVADDPNLSILGLTVKQELMIMSNGDLDRAMKCAKLMGIFNHGLFYKSVTALSGGQQARLMIASALASTANVLILDNLFGYIDKEGRTQLKSALQQLFKNAPEKNVILADYDQDFPGDVLIGCQNGLVRVYELSKKKDRQFMEDHGFKEVSWKIKSNVKLGETIASLKEATISIDGFKVLENFSIAIQRGERILLRGPNGSGKTTAMLALAGAIPVSPKRARWIKNGLRVGYAFQNARLQFVTQTVEEELWFGRDCRDNEFELWLQKWLPLVGLNGNEMISDLHYRDAKLLSVLSVSFGYDLVIFDEPTAGIDNEAINIIKNIIETLINEGKTIVVVSHDSRLKDFASRIIRF